MSERACLKAFILRLLCLLSPLVVLSCVSHEYRYIPLENPSLAQQGGALYAVPPAAPRGQLKVVPLGVVDFQPKKDVPPVRMLGVRLIFTNNSKTAAQSWTCNTREQLLELPNEGRSRPAFINAFGEAGLLPEVRIPAQERKMVDLYYPLPKNMNGASEIPEFRFQWSLHEDKEIVRDVTLFERIEVTPQIARPEPPPPTAVLPSIPNFEGGLGRVSIWWYDPRYIEQTFSHPVPLSPIVPAS